MILQVSKGARAYANHTYLVKLVEAAVACCPDIPIVLHLDHGPDFETCKSCIDGGFTSVMIDASSKPFAENIEITRKVVEYAHDHGVVVEAELGTLAGVEDEVAVEHGKESYTHPEEVEEFVGRTGCDSLAIAIGTSAHNKAATWKLMTGKTIGEVEHTLTEPRHAELYLPIWRLAFSIYANKLTANQVQKLIRAANHVQVDSCKFTSPEIVLIIGESYNRHHSQQYGYVKKTTPRQVKRERTGRLVKFTDVVSPWNLTSFVFKNLFSMHVVGQEGEWCDYPLFPELFRKAGYHVTFITNQFLPKAKEAVYDFSGGFFLNNPTLSKAQFDTRNDKLHTYDEELLADYERLKAEDGDHNLTIFHLVGQHVNYRQRTPRKNRRFTGDEYRELKPHLSDHERTVLADYDNAVLYNDSVVDEIIRRFEQKEAIVIYVPDHGEECYEGDLHFYCRMHSATIDSRLAHAEFDIPFWIWCSKKYVRRHRQIFRQIKAARNKRFMTDALPHLLVYLAGIHSKDYHPEYNLIAPEYNEMRPRILKGTTDYDKLGPMPDYYVTKKK